MPKARHISTPNSILQTWMELSDSICKLDRLNFIQLQPLCRVRRF